MTERQKKELEQLKINSQYEIKNGKTLYKRYNDYINNVEPNTQEEEVQNRTAEELRQDSNYMQTNFEKKFINYSTMMLMMLKSFSTILIIMTKRNLTLFFTIIKII